MPRMQGSFPLCCLHRYQPPDLHSGKLPKQCWHEAGTRQVIVGSKQVAKKGNLTRMARMWRLEHWVSGQT